MFGFYQFKDDKYYNKPIGARTGLSIFPYTGVNNNIPYSRPIPIRRARYSKSVLDGNNADKSDLTGYNNQHSGGPIPYIYKLRLSGITGKSSCNTSSCSALNDRDFYLYGAYQNAPYYLGNPNIGARAIWANTFTDDFYPNGIYSKTSLLATIGNTFNQTYDFFYDMFHLFLIESLDNDVDKSWLILTLNSTIFENAYDYDASLNVGGFGYKLPLLFYKEFAKDERIFALEENITLTASNSLTIDHGIHGSLNYKVLEDNQLCNFIGATVSLSPYQTTTYDIRNNHNIYANYENYGLTNNPDSRIPVTTSSGIMTAAKNYIAAPGYYQLEINNVSTLNQGKHVPCDSFFNRQFILKANDTGAGSNRYIIPNIGAGNKYIWDNTIETESYVNEVEFRRNYATFGTLSLNNPYLENINLYISSGYLELSFNNGLFGNDELIYRAANLPTNNLQNQVFNSWTLESDTTDIRDYCDFNGIQLVLTPIDTNFRHADYKLTCIPLCDTELTPTLVNITVRISGYLETNMERVNYDQELIVISDLHSCFFGNPESLSSNFVYNQACLSDLNVIPKTSSLSDKVYYWCEMNSLPPFVTYPSITESGRLNVAGSQISIPDQTGNIDQFIGTIDTRSYLFNTFDINTMVEKLFDYSGCPQRYNCNNGIPFNGSIPTGARGVTFDGAFFGSVNLIYSGILTFDGFL